MWYPIKGIDIRPGMAVKKPETKDVTTEIVGPFTGAFRKGLHFGNSCYDRIGNWLVSQGKGK